jgi:hypothetical protein
LECWLSLEVDLTETELYDKILDFDEAGAKGYFYEFLGMTKEQYKKEIHCIYCKKPKSKRQYCDAIHPYGCMIINYRKWL